MPLGGVSGPSCGLLSIWLAFLCGSWTFAAIQPGEALRDTCIRGASSGFFLFGRGALAPCLFSSCWALLWKIWNTPSAVIFESVSGGRENEELAGKWGKIKFFLWKAWKRKWKNRVWQYNLLEFLNKKNFWLSLNGPYVNLCAIDRPLSPGGHNPAFFHWILYNDSSGIHKENSSLARRARQLRPDKKPGIVPLGRLRKVVMPMKQFLSDVLAAFAAGVLVALVLRFLSR